MQIDFPYIDQIKDIKLKLQNREMSVLIGAGFSKNVSNIFPTWWELLYDIAFFLFGQEIEEEYIKIKKTHHIKKQNYIDDKINYYINKVGYLELVSMYIKQKGYRESITTYIEEKTPKIQIENNEKYLINKINGKINRERLTDEMLSLHKLLLNIPWNNIYTTNYDKMLEEARNKYDNEYLQKLINKFEKEKEELYDENLKKITERENIEKEKSKLQEENIITYTFNNETLTSPQIDPNHKDIQNKLFILNTEIKLNKLRIETIEKELVDINRVLNQYINVVDHSSKLSIKRNKNIIKLHGTLREPGNSFGFDNDSKIQYIIAKEDYENYPFKHEAFTQLMRISLLQESYCLIGFSGVDPNFIEWVKWVRDILEKGDKESKNYKIYLIDFNDDLLSDDIKLFYENHRICRISLFNKHVITFLESQTEIIINDKNNRKEVLYSFLSYLNIDNYSELKAFIEKRKKSEYQEYWNDLGRLILNEKGSDEIYLICDKLIKLKEEIINYPLSYNYTYNHWFLLNKVITLLQKLNGNSKRQEKLLDLIFIAIDDMKIILSNVFNEKEINFLESLSQVNPILNKKLLEYIVIDHVVKGNDPNGKFENVNYENDFMCFQKIMFNLFNFNFKSSYIEIKKWNPISVKYILNKSGLLSIFDTRKATTYLNKNFRFFVDTNIEQQLYYFEILKYYSKNDFESRTSLDSRISSIKSLEFKSFNDDFSQLMKEIDEKPERLNRYGADRFSISNNFSVSNKPSLSIEAIQFIQKIITLGLPINTGNYSSIKNIDDWYKIFKVVFQNYPYPAVYFTLQYSDDKMIRRIAQDFIYSDHLITETNEILPKLLNAYLDIYTPLRIKKSILFFCSELLVAVKPSKWEDLFFKIWERNDFQDKALNDNKNEAYIFIISSIPFIKDIKIIRSIIEKCIVDYNENINVKIEFLYYLAKSKKIKKSVKNNLLSKRIDIIIQNLKENNSLFFFLGNLYEILSSEQISAVKDQLLSIDFQSLDNERIWKILLYFSKGNNQVIKYIKSGIIQNINLWNTGFNSDGSLSMTNNFIVLHSFNVKWTKKEVEKIYYRLRDELQKIESWNNNKSYTDFKFILEEMYYFLENEKDKLVSISDFENTYNKLLEFYNHDKGYSNVIEGIISNDGDKIKWALSEISYYIYKKKDNFDGEVCMGIIIDKILLDKNPTIEACLNFISNLLKDKKNKHLFINHIHKIILILKKYQNKILENVDKVFLYNSLILIAQNLRKIYITDEYKDVLDYWENIKKENRYNYKIL